MNSTLGVPGTSARRRLARSESPPPSRTSTSERDDRRGGAEHGEDGVLCRAWEPEHYVLFRAAMSPAAELAYRIGAAARRPASWLQLVKFGLVGGSGYLINLAVFAVLSGRPRRPPRRSPRSAPSASRSPTTSCSTATGPSRAGDGHAGFQAMRFFAVSVAALLINLVALEALVSETSLGDLSAQAIAVAIAMPFNFLGNKLWTFA